MWDCCGRRKEEGEEKGKQGEEDGKVDRDGELSCPARVNAFVFRSIRK